MYYPLAAVSAYVQASLSFGILRTSPRYGLLGLCHSVDLGIHGQLVGLAFGHGGGLAQRRRSCSAGCPGLEAGGPLPQLDRHGDRICGIVRPNRRRAGCCRPAEGQVRVEPGGAERCCLNGETQDEGQDQGQGQYSFPHKNTSLLWLSTLYNQEGRRFVTLDMK